MQTFEHLHCPQRSCPHTSGTADLKRRLRRDAAHLRRAFRVATRQRLRDLVVIIRKPKHPPISRAAELLRTFMRRSPEPLVARNLIALAVEPLLCEPRVRLAPEGKHVLAAMLFQKPPRKAKATIDAHDQPRHLAPKLNQPLRNLVPCASCLEPNAHSPIFSARPYRRPDMPPLPSGINSPRPVNRNQPQRPFSLGRLRLFHSSLLTLHCSLPHLPLRYRSRPSPATPPTPPCSKTPPPPAAA